MFLTFLRQTFTLAKFRFPPPLQFPLIDGSIIVEPLISHFIIFFVIDVEKNIDGIKADIESFEAKMGFTSYFEQEVKVKYASL